MRDHYSLNIVVDYYQYTFSVIHNITKLTFTLNDILKTNRSVSVCSILNKIITIRDDFDQQVHSISVFLHKKLVTSSLAMQDTPLTMDQPRPLVAIVTSIG